MRFFIAEMEKDHLILGHPFVSIVNPEINWKKKRVTGPAIDILMIGFSTAQGLLRKTQLWALRVCGRQSRSGETVYYRRVITNQEEPYQWQKKQARVVVQRLPKEHWKVFHQEKQSPRRKGNRKIPLWHSDFREINCKIYPLSKEEEGHIWQLLREEQKRGYIGQKTAPTFVKDKRERQLILGYRRINTYVIQDNKEMTSIHHTPESSSPPLGKRSPLELPAKESESANAKWKGKQKAIPETHTSPPSESPFSPEINKRHLWPSTLPTSPHIEQGL
jgi:hypothetical protein